MGSTITVHKLNEQGDEVFRYSGTLIEEHGTSLTLQARFDRSDIQFYELTLREGDRFIETYFTDRWLNIFEIHDADEHAEATRIKTLADTPPDPAEQQA